MQSIFYLTYRIISITVIILHIWTIIIALEHSGTIAAIITFILPVISEIFWIVRMIGENDAYVTFAIIHIVLTIPIMLITEN